uniref:SET domain-containing protein n=1 Tax=Schizophyllum commune (strain H4-8 / FGSC 9210) TaxID=578458 RepID=D8QBI2_SCHCM
MSLGAFEQWFVANGGFVDKEYVGLTEFPEEEGGRGMVALKDIPADHTLFSIPRSIVLSTRTSPLPSLFGADAWKERQLDKGWGGLILCMMWESAQPDRKWKGYLDSLPTEFSTPMFWTEEEIAELTGTAVVDHIGKQEADQEYTNKVLPAIQSRPDLFPPSLLSTHFSLTAFHINGSRVLSRSFNVEEGDDDSDSDDEGPADKSADLMDVDATEPPPEGGAEEAIEVSDDEDSDEEDAGDVGMVPMADMLNARYGSENAKLFYEPTVLKMISTKPIKAGDQVWNTYADPPNSALLRRYGHVDVIAPDAPNASTDGQENVAGAPNPADIVEVRADLVVRSAIERAGGSDAEEAAKERIDWWLDEGGDDVFILDTSCALPTLLISLIRLLRLARAEYEKAIAKGKLPKGKLKPETDEDAADVLRIVKDALERKAGEYVGGADPELLTSNPPLPPRKRCAVIIRLGEKRILRKTIERVEEMLAKAEAAKAGYKLSGKDQRPTKANGGKRKGAAEEARGGGKKARR